MTNPLDALVSLGDPRLRRVNTPVVDPADQTFGEARETLHAALAAFRLEHGFGRAMQPTAQRSATLHRYEPG